MIEVKAGVDALLGLEVDYNKGQAQEARARREQAAAPTPEAVPGAPDVEAFTSASPGFDAAFAQRWVPDAADAGWQARATSAPEGTRADREPIRLVETRGHGGPT